MCQTQVYLVTKFKHQSKKNADTSLDVKWIFTFTLECLLRTNGMKEEYNGLHYMPSISAAFVRILELISLIMNYSVRATSNMQMIYSKIYVNKHTNLNTNTLAN